MLEMQFEKNAIEVIERFNCTQFHRKFNFKHQTRASY